MSKQSPASATTRYEVTGRKPSDQHGYPQRIAMWEAVNRLGSANRGELLAALRAAKYERPNYALVDEKYCRVELTDMCKRGFLRRIQD